MKMLPKVTIVINTLNRGSYLERTLESLLWLKYAGQFEVIVVCGPSTDNTNSVVEKWNGKIRVGICSVPNLSTSRNIGICMANGEIIAFIDDDAIPEPEWIAQIVDGFDSSAVGGAGGKVFDHTGYNWQYQYATSNRLGNGTWNRSKATPYLCFPFSYEFPYLQGTNTAFRRSALLEIGGFDEEYEYYLDETEVCLRLIDKGYIINQLPNAYVHHKYAASDVRDTNFATRNYYPIVKNKIYFSQIHGTRFHTKEEIDADTKKFIENTKKEIDHSSLRNILSQQDVAKCLADLERAVQVGNKRGIDGVSESQLITEQKIKKWEGEFLPFQPLKNSKSKSIVLVCRDFPPGHSGGIATFNRDLAEALALEGSLVHVVTCSTTINRVDFEFGVWIHRVVVRDIPLSHDATSLNVPQNIWNWSATALQEVKRIASHRTIDVVETPIWDCEGIAFLLNDRWPLVVSLQTTMYFWLQSHPDYSGNTNWMRDFGNPLLALEKEIMQRAHAIRSISMAIRRQIEEAYGFVFDEAKIIIAPLGMKDSHVAKSCARNETPTVLFVGRLESRKGIDVLLSAVPLVVAKVPDARFRLIGDDSLLGPNGKTTFKESFLASPEGRMHAQQVHFEGRVGDEILCQAYADCDVFVAPSIFESFGLVFLEAMRAGRPVIGCQTSGVPEVVVHDECGLLVPPGDVHALACAIIRLLQSKTLRDTMGAAGRIIFDCKFTSAEMARASESIFEKARLNHRISTKLKISYINGICVKHDAISTAVCDGIRVIGCRANYDIKLYAYKCEFDSVPFVKVNDPEDIVNDKHFRDSDLVIFHFGVYYPLFDLLKKKQGNTKQLVVFHNITPKEFVDSENHDIIDRSFSQMSMIALADHVICDSEVNLAVLRDAGINTPATILPLAVQQDQEPPDSKPSFFDGVVRVVFIGRFVRSKGPCELLQSIRIVLRHDNCPRIQVDLLGNVDFSSINVVGEIRDLQMQIEEEFVGLVRIQMHGSASDEQKKQILRDADLFVLPTYHEGFCVPIVEALANGCQIIAYNNSNVPVISGGLAALVPTGDIQKMSEEIEKAFRHIRTKEWQDAGYMSHVALARSHIVKFSPNQVNERFAQTIDQIIHDHSYNTP